MLFSCEVSVVKSTLLACWDTWQYTYEVYRVCCMLSVVCVSNNRRDASTAVHAPRMPQTEGNNTEMENGILVIGDNEARPQYLQ